MAAPVFWMLLCCFLFTACTSESGLRLTPIVPPTSDADEMSELWGTATPMRVEVPVTVEVTRVYTQQVVVEATPTPPSPCAQRRFEETGEITIGSLLPLSGSGAFSAGFAMQTALNIAVEQVTRTESTRPVTWRLITYDTAGQGQRAAEFAHRLITLDCAAAIIGGYHSAVALATADLTDAYQVPYIVLHAAADELTQRTSVFRIAPSFSMYAQMPGALIQKLDQTRAQPIDDVLYIIEPGTISPALIDAMSLNLQSVGIHAEIWPVDLPAQDFSSVIARILSRPTLPDIIFIQIYSQDALTLHAQLLQAGIGPDHQVTIVNSHGARDSHAYWHALPQGIDTVVPHFGPWPGRMTSEGEEFVAAYGPYGDHWPPAFVFAAYDAVLLFTDAAIKAQSLEGTALITALEQTDIHLAAGHYQFGPLSDPDSSPTTEAASPASAVRPFSSRQWANVPIYYLRYTRAEQPLEAMTVEWSADELFSHYNQSQD